MLKPLAAAALLFAANAWAQDAGTSAPLPQPELDVSSLPFNPEAIKVVMTHHRPKIQQCYEELLATKDKAPKGKILTSFTITAEGLVKKPKVLGKGTTIKDRKLHTCVVTVLSTLEFPKPKDKRDYPVEFPFALTPVE